MAIRDLNGGQTTENVQAEPKAFAPNPNATPRRALSFSSASLFGAPISRTSGSKNLIELKKALAETYANVSGDYSVTLLSVDNVEERDFVFSFIVVALQRKSTGPTSGVAYHTLIVEATGDKVGSYSVQEGNSQLQVLRVTGDAYNEILVRRAAELVHNAFPEANWHRAVDATVVPRTFNVEDTTAVHMLALSAGMACGTELELSQPDFGDLSLSTIARDQSIEINVGFNRGQIADAVGEPMRSDVLVNLALRRQGNNNQNKNILNGKDSDIKVAELSGYIDLLWAPINGGGSPNPYLVNQQVPTQRYAARLVITNMASNSAYTPASMLLSLISAVSLRDDNNWIQAFRPQPLTTGIDLRDIGALNIEAGIGAEPGQPGQRIDTKAENFRLEDLGQLVSALVQPGLIISFDVPECGPQTWYSSLFAAAANGSKAAYDIIYKAAMELTDSNFGKYFRPGDEMFADKNNRIHLGYWNDGNTRRDIREIDYTAVANLGGERDPAVIRDWSDTFTRTDFSQNLRLASREKMITAFTRETAEFTGFAQRVTFTSQFIDALVRSSRETGFNPTVKTPLTASDFNNARGVANFIGAALVQPGQAYYNTAAGFVPGQVPFAGGGYYRY